MCFFPKSPIGPVWFLDRFFDETGPIGRISERNTKPTETSLYLYFRPLRTYFEEEAATFNTTSVTSVESPCEARILTEVRLDRNKLRNILSVDAPSLGVTL
jgi:hypothetical protein